MKPVLAALLIGLLGPLSVVSDDVVRPHGPDTSPESDSRLARIADAKPQKIGVLTFFPNKGGGYTFLEGKDVAFVALPYLPITATFNHAQIIGAQGKRRFIGPVTIGSIGTSKMPFGSQTLYRSQMTEKAPGFVVRDDTPIATLARDNADGHFRLSILAEDSETRTKLKSIKPVLERAEHTP
jgi:hypothetical protein